MSEIDPKDIITDWVKVADVITRKDLLAIQRGFLWHYDQAGDDIELQNRAIFAMKLMQQIIDYLDRGKISAEDIQ